jgi:lysophospholipase L1-like esterase
MASGSGSTEDVKLQPSALGHKFGIGKQILFSTILVLGLLGLAEGAIRVWALYFRTSYEQYDSRTGRLQLRPNIHYMDSRGKEFRINGKGFVGPEFDDRPAPGVYRIISLGDSCTFATGLWQIGYPFQLERQLNAGAADRRFEVINAGIEGFNSTFALARLRDELLQYQPRLVIIYIGWNDLMKTDPANAALVDEHAWLAELLDRSYLIKAYKKLLFVNLRPLVFKPAIDGAQSVETFDDFAPTRYRSNLEAMVELLASHNVKAILVTLPTVVRPGMTGQELKQANVFFPYFTRAYGVSPLLSLHRVYNRTITEVGRQKEVEVVDLASRFEAVKDRTPYFWDTMHPNEKGGALIAEILAARIRALDAESRL